MLIDIKNLKDKYQLNIKGIIHIGAHHGLEMSTYEEIGVKNIIFFEPLSENFKILTENIGDKALLVNKALGCKIGEIEMNVESDNKGMSSSILEPQNVLFRYPWIKFNKKEIVEISTLDIEVNDIDNYNFLNIDVQGYELEVLKGSQKTLDCIDYIMTEVNSEEIYKDCAIIEELDTFLTRFGFERVETVWVDGWGDAFYVKKT
jgi:FkbM family methyltransferase